MKKIAVAMMLLIASVSAYAADNGLISKKSKYSVTETIDR